METLEGLLRDKWSNMEEEDKKAYKRVSPGTFKDDQMAKEIESKDLEKYSPQDLFDQISEHFSLVLLIPTEVDILTIPAP
jgi:hypothetical protein